MTKKKNRGSIVLEASLVLPIFLSFLFLLITFIRIATVQMALDNAVTEATKQIATHMYPVDLLYGELSDTTVGSNVNKGLDEIDEKRGKVLEVEEFLKENSEVLPKEVDTIITLRQSIENGIVDIYDKTLSLAFQPIIDYYADKNILELENLKVTKVMLPDLRKRENLYFGIEVRYDMPLNIPFFGGMITFKESAYERVWVGDGVQNRIPISEDDTSLDSEDSNLSDSDDESNEEQEEEARLVIESINSPVQRGHYVRIFAKGPPNQTANIRIIYASGFIKNKKLTFDANGYGQSDPIKIGGHADPGIFRVVLTTKTQTAEDTFEVLSKEDMDKYIEERNGGS